MYLQLDFYPRVYTWRTNSLLDVVTQMSNRYLKLNIPKPNYHWFSQTPQSYASFSLLYLLKSTLPFQSLGSKTLELPFTPLHLCLSLFTTTPWPSPVSSSSVVASRFYPSPETDLKILVWSFYPTVIFCPELVFRKLKV